MNKMNYKKKYNKILIVLGIIAGVIILPELLISLKEFSFKMIREDLPEKYRNVTTLDNLKDNTYEVEVFSEDFNGGIFPVVNGDVILETETKNATKFYRINPDGCITDSLICDRSNYMIENNDVIVDLIDNKYSFWIRNGKKEFSNIEHIDHKIFTEKEVLDLYKNNLIYSTGVDYKGKYIDKVFIYKDNKVITLYADISSDLWEYIETDENTLSPINNDEKLYDSIFGVAYAHKDTMEVRRFWDSRNFAYGGTGGGVGRGRQPYIGAVYFRLKLPKKTIYYTDNGYSWVQDYDKKDSVDYGKEYEIYKPNNTQYMIIDGGYGIRIIRPKNTKNKNSTK